MEWLDRHIEPQVLAGLADTPVVMIVGPRQVGKSTLCRRIADSSHPATYYTLDDATLLAAARADPAGFINALDGPVVIDEVQRSPDLLLAIKASVDRDRSPGRFLLTGSADVMTLPTVSESLAGRIDVLTLWPLSQGELEKRPESFVDAAFGNRPPFPVRFAQSRIDLLRRALKGGYPAALDRHDDQRRHAWFGSYVTTILQRDVRDISNIEGLSDLPRLLSLIAARAMSLVNYSEVSRAAAMPQSTLKRYIALLEATLLLREIPAWSANLGKRLIKSSRLVITDTGLLAYLAGHSLDHLGHNSTAAGPLIENFVAMEVLKQISWSEVQPKLYHYRTVTGQEVDLLLEANDGRVVGIEVKAGGTVNASAFSGLRQLRDALGTRFVSGIVLYAGQSSVPFSDNLIALPIDALWL